jgi:hypothetical protein
MILMLCFKPLLEALFLRLKTYLKVLTLQTKPLKKAFKNLQKSMLYLHRLRKTKS